ncbi:M50 family metallopeptidase [Glutamicibacter sp. 287]|nr:MULTISPECIES: M50 family metallopeptidase [Micrococcaceae]
MREIDDRNASGANMIVDLNGAWARLWESQPVDLVSGQWTILLVLVLGLVLPRPVWRITGMYSTLVHELGHVISALFTGRFVTGLRLGWDHSGEVVSRGRGKVSIIISGIFGYPAPLLVSAALLWATAAGYAGRALGIYALFFVLALVFVRNWPAFVVCSASALVALGVVFFAPSSAYIYLALLLGGFLLCSGIRDYLKVLAVHTWRRRDIEQSDAYLIARATGTFATLWLLVIMALGGAGIFLGVQSLLRLF